MKKKLTITISPSAITLNAFAKKCGREYAVINNAIEDGTLNHGLAFESKTDKGMKMVILDEEAKKFQKRCKVLDTLKK